MEQPITALSGRELAAKDLRTQEGKNAEKEEEEDQERDDGLHAVNERGQEVLQGPPIPSKREKWKVDRC